MSFSYVTLLGVFESNYDKLTASYANGSVVTDLSHKMKTSSKATTSYPTGDQPMETATELESTTTFRDAVSLGGRPTIDIADLVAMLLASNVPDRDSDLLVEIMLGGKTPLKVIDEARVRAGFWLREQVPTFTAGNEALALLAHRRGLKTETYSDGALWHVETRSLATGARVVVKHVLQGVAGIAGIAALTTKEQSV
jgi:hypothetical protein